MTEIRGCKITILYLNNQLLALKKDFAHVLLYGFCQFLGGYSPCLGYPQTDVRYAFLRFVRLDEEPVERDRPKRFLLKLAAEREPAPVPEQFLGYGSFPAESMDNPGLLGQTFFPDLY